MRTMFIAGLLTLCFTAPAQKNLKGPFTVSVNISGMKVKPPKMILQYRSAKNASETIRDTIVVNGNEIVFSGVVDEPKEATISIVSSSLLYNAMNFFLEPGPTRIIVHEDMAHTDIKAGTFQRDMDSLHAAETRWKTAHPLVLTDAEKAVTSNDAQAYMRVDAKREHWQNEMLDSAYGAFVVQHAREGAIAVYALDKYTGESDLLIRPSALNAADSMFRLLSPALQALPRARALKARIDKALAVTIGRIAPDFTLPDTSGRMISLSSFRGNYVLVDFWASWCHWCRAESPNILAAYNKYHTKGFNVLQVSLDSKSYEGAWHKAIRDDHTDIWTQVCPLSDINSVAELYGVKAIPQNFLLGPDGKIIAVNLREDAVSQKLAEIFH